MPLAGFECPSTGDTIDIEAASEYFEDNGIVPAEVIDAIVLADIKSSTLRSGTHLSPSIADPESTCRREVVIKRFLPYFPLPYQSWLADEGTAIHAYLQQAGATIANNKSKFEVRLPTEEHRNLVDVTRTEDGVLEVSILPKIPMSGQIDRVTQLSNGNVDITDYKTKGYPWTYKKDADPVDYSSGEAKKAQIQLNFYRFMYEKLFGVKVENLWIWKIYKGSRKRNKTFTKIPVPMMTLHDLAIKASPHLLSLGEMLLNAESLTDKPEKLEKYIASLPMDGEKMFNGQKCPLYCDGYKICFGLSGKAVF